jgi:RNA polymerase sigma factor (sigma-70 family)
MLGSQEDAEDVLQEVFAAAFNAICADERPINARPWLYRIARNRCLNHLRRPQPTGQDSMDIFERDGGTTTADTVHKREEFRHIVCDVQELPETQRTALLLREIDALSYDQIAEAMDTTVPSVKSLLVRARVSLAEAAESRLLTCDEVRLELGQVAEGLAKNSPPIRRHLKHCDRCRTFRGELRRTTRALAAIYPIGPFLFLKKLSLAKLGLGGAGAAGGAAASGGGAGLAGTAATTAGGITAGGAFSAGVGTIASKAAAGMAAAVIVTAGAVEVKHAATSTQPRTASVAPPAPSVAPTPPPPPARALDRPARKPKPKPVAHRAAATPAVKPEPKPAPAPTPPAKPAPVQEEQSTATLPDREAPPVPAPPSLEQTPPAAEPGEPESAPPESSQPAGPPEEEPASPVPPVLP